MQAAKVKVSLNCIVPFLDAPPNPLMAGAVVRAAARSLVDPECFAVLSEAIAKSPVEDTAITDES
jgi:hypothetical protein